MTKPTYWASRISVLSFSKEQAHIDYPDVGVSFTKTVRKASVRVRMGTQGWRDYDVVLSDGEVQETSVIEVADSLGAYGWGSRRRQHVKKSAKLRDIVAAVRAQG